jgi:hypothetical protein
LPEITASRFSPPFLKWKTAFTVPDAVSLMLLTEATPSSQTFAAEVFLTRTREHIDTEHPTPSSVTVLSIPLSIVSLIGRDERCPLSSGNGVLFADVARPSPPIAEIPITNNPNFGTLFIFRLLSPGEITFSESLVKRRVCVENNSRTGHKRETSEKDERSEHAG